MSTVNFEAANSEDFSYGRTVFAPKDGAHSRHKFPGTERLRKIVVRTTFKSGNAVGFVAPRREHDHWDLRGETNAPQHFPAVSAGQHHVKHDELIFPFESVPHTRFAVVDGLYFKTIHAQKAF